MPEVMFEDPRIEGAGRSDHGSPSQSGAPLPGVPHEGPAGPSVSDHPGVVVVHEGSADAVTTALCQALGAEPWPAGGPPAPQGAKVVVIVRGRADVLKVIDELRRGSFAPDLVVAWDVPEFWLAQLLVERLPAVDGSVVDDPAVVLEHLGSNGWTDEELRGQLELAEALNVLEEHVEEGAP